MSPIFIYLQNEYWSQYTGHDVMIHSSIFVVQNLCSQKNISWDDIGPIMVLIKFIGTEKIFSDKNTLLLALFAITPP